MIRRINRRIIAVTCNRHATDTEPSPDRSTCPARKKIFLPKVKLNRRAWNLALSDALQGKDLRAKR
jgi:hypothetical protein